MDLIKEDSFTKLISGLDTSVSIENTPTAPSKPLPTTTNVPAVSMVQDTSPVIAFLQGKKCLTGVREFSIFNIIFEVNIIFFAGHWLVEI